MPLLTCKVSGEVIRLHCFGGDAPAFARLLCNVWNRIPMAVQQSIVEYWNLYGATYEPPLQPHFELSNYLPVDVYGQVNLNGMELKFSSSAFEVFPDSVASWVVAHELAHVYQKARGLPPGGDDYGENEEHADSLARSWGFEEHRFQLMILLQNKIGSLELACQNINRRFNPIDLKQ